MGKLPLVLAPVDSRDAEQFMWYKYHDILLTVKRIAPLLCDIFRDRRYRGALAYKCSILIIHMFGHVWRYVRDIENLRDYVHKRTPGPKTWIDARQYGFISVSHSKGSAVTRPSTPEEPPPLPDSITVTPEAIFQEYIAFRSERWAARRAKVPIGTKAEDLPKEPNFEGEAKAFVRILVDRLEDDARTESVHSQG